HLTPEAAEGGPIAKLRDGDVVRLDATRGELVALVDADEWENRTAVSADLSGNQFGMGVELLTSLRATVSSADTGASVL
ncbi:MAG: dihydroxy-acid dehydratase, partial [Rhizobiaceae bacterium]